jgi:hypothetical protein
MDTTQIELTDAQAGWEVLASGGDRMGTVATVQGGYFALDMRGGGDYWLSSAYVDRCEDGVVRLSLSKDEADEHRLRQPGLEPQQAVGQASMRDHVLNEREALEVRERMERELLEQRGTMDTGLRGHSDDGLH